MVLNRSKNARINILTGIINKIPTLLFPLLIQMVIIKKLGAEYLGVKSLFTSILQVLNLSELGIGSAVVYCMYQPIAENDLSSICALLNYFKILYRKIGFFILLCGVVITPILPKFITGTVPQQLNIYIVFLLYLFNTCITYLFYGYKSAILNAYQRVDILNDVGTGIHIIMSLVQLFVLFYLKNFYAFLLVAILFSILNNYIISLRVNQLYPSIKAFGIIDADERNKLKNKVAGLSIYKICATTRNSFDSIFLSMFFGLTVTAMYNNYYYIMATLTGIMAIVQTSLMAGVGNSIVVEGKEKNYADMMRINFVYMFLSGWFSICLVCLYQPFMLLWMGEEMLLPDGVVILFGLYFYILKMGDIRALYSDAAGLWWENRHRTILEAACNPILNFVLVRYWGIYGIIIATIITLFFIGFLGSAYILFKNYFQMGFKEFLFQHLFYAMISIFVGVLIYWMCSLVNGSILYLLAIRFLICGFITPMILVLIYRGTNIYKSSVPWLKLKLFS